VNECGGGEEKRMKRDGKKMFAVSFDFDYTKTYPRNLGLYVAGLAIDVIEGERGDEKLEEGGRGAGESDGEGNVEGPEVSGYSMASIAVTAFFARD